MINSDAAGRTGRVGVAVVGAGTISAEYLSNLCRFPDVEVLVVADAFADRAKTRAERYGVPGHGDLATALEHPDVEIVVNLTIPAAHVEVSTAALQAGKHVYTEKPFATDRDSGRALLELAAARGLRVGAAPDTFLGAGLQLAQRLIQRGDIGVPVSALTITQEPGPESWHPDPAFLYASGAGPLWDRGPYYFAMLAQLFGPVRSVAAMATTAYAERRIGAGPLAGQTFPVQVPTNVSVIAEFDDGGAGAGRTAQSTYSFESPLPRPALVEVTGTEGTMALPDPNRYGGDVYVYPLRRRSLDEIRAMPPQDTDRTAWVGHACVPNPPTRGTCVLEMARALRAGVPHRASGELGYHVLDTLTAIDESIAGRSFVRVASDAPKADPLPQSWSPFEKTVF